MGLFDGPCFRLYHADTALEKSGAHRKIHNKIIFIVALVFFGQDYLDEVMMFRGCRCYEMVDELHRGHFEAPLDIRVS
jgi:hypothetical protein